MVLVIKLGHKIGICLCPKIWYSLVCKL